jgi:hypothetical protein
LGFNAQAAIGGELKRDTGRNFPLFDAMEVSSQVCQIELPSDPENDDGQTLRLDEREA